MEVRRYKLITLSPVHIGSKEELAPYEFVIWEGYLYKIDLVRLYLDKQWSSHLPYGISDLKVFKHSLTMVFRELVRRGETDKFTLWRARVTNRVAKEFEDVEKFKGISLLPRAPKPYIPGSSLKGIIRTCLLNAIVERKYLPWEKIPNDDFCLRTYAKSGRGKKISAVLEACILDSLVKRKDRWQPEFYLDLFQFILVSDSSALDNTEVLHLDIITRSGKSRSSNALTTPVEVVSEGSEVEIEIRWDQNRYKKARGYRSRKSIISNLTIEQILKVVSNRTKELMIKEIERIKRSSLPLEYKNPLTEFYGNLSKEAETNGKFIMRMGKYKTRHFNVIEKYSKKLLRNFTETKTVTITETRRPLGWVMLEEVN